MSSSGTTNAQPEVREPVKAWDTAAFMNRPSSITAKTIRRVGDSSARIMVAAQLV
jgi:hypothetical protein